MTTAIVVYGVAYYWKQRGAFMGSSGRHADARVRHVCVAAGGDKFYDPYYVLLDTRHLSAVNLMSKVA